MDSKPDLGPQIACCMVRFSVSN